LEFHRREFVPKPVAMLLAVLEGQVLVPTPSWVSYIPQTRILRKQVVLIRVGANDYKLTPPPTGTKTASKGADAQSILILNSPDNPTGAVYT
jgi:aspartate aminotransferase